MRSLKQYRPKSIDKLIKIAKRDKEFYKFSKIAENHSKPWKWLLLKIFRLYWRQGIVVNSKSFILPTMFISCFPRSGMVCIVEISWTRLSFFRSIELWSAFGDRPTTASHCPLIGDRRSIVQLQQGLDSSGLIVGDNTVRRYLRNLVWFHGF